MRYLSLVALLTLSTACSVWSRSPSMWKDIRPGWEDRLTRDVHRGFFEGRPEVKIKTFVMPVGEPPEVRFVILANLDATLRPALVDYVEDVVRDVMRYASTTLLTDRVRIQITTYAGGRRQSWEYWDHLWTDLPADTSDTQMIREARNEQTALARQNGLE